MKTAYIIEDEEMLRTLLATFFETMHPEIELLGMTGDGTEGFEQCLALEPDLVIVDVGLPELNGLEILRLLKTRLPRTKVLVFSGDASNQTLKIVVRGKADGFINKGSGVDELEKAIEAADRGETFFSTDIEDAVRRIREQENELQTSPKAP